MYVIKNATIYTMDELGVFQGDICFENGKITKIGTDICVEGATVIDATGKVVTPGFVDPHSHVGGFAVHGNQDLNEMTNPVTAELDAYYAINPDDELFQVGIEQGITTSCIAPGSANVICGWVVAYKSAGENRLVRHPVALKGAMGINPKGVYSKKNQAPMTRMAIANIMRTYLRNVQEYMKKKAEAGDDASKMPAYDLGLEHGIPVLEKKIPLKVHSYMHDMLTVLEIAKEFDIYVTLDHAPGCTDFVEELNDPHVKGLIFGPSACPLFGGEGGKLDPECGKIFDDLGVPITVMTDAPVSPINMLLYEMGEAVRHGMDPVRALAMITSISAKIVGVEDRVGSLAVGKDADVLIWTKLPSEATDAVLEQVFIDGKSVYEREAD